MKIEIDSHFKNLILPLTDEEFSNLENSILKDGCRDPLILWKNILIDGHHRYQICSNHKIKFNVIKMSFSSRSEASNWIIENQLSRRNCTPESISYLRGIRYKNEKLEPCRPNKTDKPATRTSVKLSNFYKVSERTIRKDQKFANAVDRVTNCFLPKKRITIKKQLLIDDRTLTKKDIIELSSFPKEIIKDVIENKTDISDARIEVKRQVYKDSLKKVSVKSKDITLLHGDCLKLSEKLEPASIDHIITDPPYASEHLECWNTLGSIAARVLKPGGFLITYSGKLHLSEIFSRLSEHLSYYWQLILLHTGKIDTGYNPITVHPRKVNTMYKPILVFFKPPIKKPSKYFNDIIKGSGIAKDYHKWQQSENELKIIFDIFTKPGQTILDPFAGAATTLVAAKKLKIKAIGFEIDKKNYEMGLKRISSIK